MSAAENELVGQSAAMRDVRRLIEIAAPAKTTVLVLGDTGTGKERTNGNRGLEASLDGT